MKVALTPKSHARSRWLIMEAFTEASTPLLTIWPSRFTHFTTDPGGAGWIGALGKSRAVVVFLNTSTVAVTRPFRRPRSRPIFSCLSDCHLRKMFGLFTWPRPPLVVKEYFCCAAPAGNSWLPVLPQPARSLNEENRPTPLKKSSRSMFQAAEKE